MIHSQIQENKALKIGTHVVGSRTTQQLHARLNFDEKVLFVKGMFVEGLGLLAADNEKATSLSNLIFTTLIEAPYTVSTTIMILELGIDHEVTM
jgi:hypothetical protein